MSSTRDPVLTLEIAQEMVAEFENYLLADSLYRQLKVETSAGDRMPKMSAGSLLKRLRDLEYAKEAGQLTAAQADQLAELTDEFERLAKRHAAAYREKLAWELKSQIDSWRWFMQDCLEDPSGCQDEYPFEVRIRNRIALLMEALGKGVPADQRSRIEELDDDLEEVFASGAFVLDDDLQDRYPRDRYWWLYGHPEEND